MAKMAAAKMLGIKKNNQWLTLILDKYVLIDIM